MDGRNTTIEGSKVGWKERTERTDGMREINRQINRARESERKRDERAEVQVGRERDRDNWGVMDFLDGR